MRNALLSLAAAALLTPMLTAPAHAQTKKPAAHKPTARPKATNGASLKAALAAGAPIYKQYCLSCHQADGSGVPNLNPPLAQTTWVLGEKPRLINTLLKGLQGQPIDGTSYASVMPSHQFLTDQQIAAVLTYVRNSFDNKASAITAAEVKAVRAQN